MGVLVKLGVITGAIYLIVCAGLFALQDRFLFFPHSDEISPSEDWISATKIETEDGEALVAWYSAAEPGCPTTLFFHGNGSHVAADEWRYERLHEKGVGFLALSWRGYAGSTGKPSEVGLHKDARAAWEWLIAKGLSPAEIIVHGFSLGSGPAVKLASQEDEGALILEAPYYSMQDVVSKKFRIIPTGLLLRHKLRSDLFISDVGAPVLMAHGTADRLIPISQSERLFERALEPKTYVALEGSDHNELVRDGLYEAVWPFITQHWQAGDAPDESTNCFLHAGAQDADL